MRSQTAKRPGLPRCLKTHLANGNLGSFSRFSRTGFWGAHLLILVARGLRILQEFAGFCRRNLLILFRIRVGIQTHNLRVVLICEHPGAKKRLNHTWNKLDFVAMAKKTGELGTLIVPGYYLPLRHAHPTFGGLGERLEIVDDHMSLKAEAQTEIVDRSLMTAHNCILDALKIQSLHFKIEGLEEAIQVCYRDFFRVWSPDSPLLKAGSGEGGP
jgi:hypothetical protein